MISQRFYPVKILLIPIQNQCCPSEDDYFNRQYNLDSSTVSEMILSSEETLLNTLKSLSMLSREKDVMQHVQHLDPKCRFLLYATIQIAFLHFHADTELLPLTPDDKIYYLLFAYLQEGYFSFKKYCQQQELDLWDQILSYECERLEDL